MRKKPTNFTFIDLFAGIGGTRLGFEQAGGKCVFSSEWDAHCQKTYFANFGHQQAGDITAIASEEIPEHDVLVAGFPCQPFSIAGVSKKISLGKKHGFEDKEQGNLFFEILRILAFHRPAAFMLENVKNLISHDRGNTFRIIIESLQKLNYSVQFRVLSAYPYVPQHRERIFIVGFNSSQNPNCFEYPKPPKKVTYVQDILDDNNDHKYTISDHLWRYLRDYAEKHRARGNGFGYGLVDSKTAFMTRTLSARYYKDGSEILIKQPRKNPRRLTPRECARLMGFPDNFKIVVSDTQAYKQFGNSVVVPLVEAVAQKIFIALDNDGRSNKKSTKLEYVQNSFI